METGGKSSTGPFRIRRMKNGLARVWHKRDGKVSEKKRSFCGRQKYFLRAFSCVSRVFSVRLMCDHLVFLKKYQCVDFDQRVKRRKLFHVQNEREGPHQDAMNKPDFSGGIFYRQHVYCRRQSFVSFFNHQESKMTKNDSPFHPNLKLRDAPCPTITNMPT